MVTVLELFDRNNVATHECYKKVYLLEREDIYQNEEWQTYLFVRKLAKYYVAIAAKYRSVGLSSIVTFLDRKITDR